MYEQLETAIFSELAKDIRTGKDGKTGTAYKRLIKYGITELYIQQRLSQITGLSVFNIKNLLEQSILDSIRDEKQLFYYLGVDIGNPIKNKAVNEILQAEWNKTKGNIENLTRTTIKQTYKDLIDLLNKQDLLIASGLKSYDEAYIQVLEEYAQKGQYIEYESGARRSVEAAIRGAIVTSMNQTSAEITNHYIAEGKIEYVLVSAHIGARTAKEGQPPEADHMQWQGRIYKINGSEPDIPNLLEATGYDIISGTGEVVNPLGLHGYNCRHSHTPWDPKLINPYRDKYNNLLDGKGNIITEERNAILYELTQKQRALERGIRKQKRLLQMKHEIIKNITDEKLKQKLNTEYLQQEKALFRKNKEYNDFCKKNELQPKYTRLRVINYKD